MTAGDVVGPVDRHPWERQPGETAKAYEAFALYRDMLGQGSLTKVAQLLHEGLPKKGRPKPESIRSQLAEWSAKHKWVDRRDAYVDELDARLRAQRETEIDAMQRRRGQVGNVLATMGLTRLHGGTIQTANGDAHVTAVDLNDATIADALSMVKLGLDQQALALGIATQIMGARITISRADLDEIVDKIVKLTLAVMPEELHERWWLGMERIARGGGS